MKFKTVAVLNEESVEELNALVSDAVKIAVAREIANLPKPQLTKEDAALTSQFKQLQVQVRELTRQISQ